MLSRFAEAQQPVTRADWSLSLERVTAKKELGVGGKIQAFVVDRGQVQGIRFGRLEPTP